MKKESCWWLPLHFWCINNIKARNEKSEWKKQWFFNENLRLLRYHRRVWSRKAGGKRHAYSAFGCRRSICSAVERAGKVLWVACSSTTMPLPAKTKKWRKKQKSRHPCGCLLFFAKCGSDFIDIRPKMWFDIHRALWYCKDSRGAHKTTSDCKMTFCDNVMLLTTGGDFYE